MFSSFFSRWSFSSLKVRIKITIITCDLEQIVSIFQTSIILLISFLRSFFLSSLYIRFENERMSFSQCLYERSRNNLCIYILIHGCFICVRRTMNDEVIMNWINSFSSKYVLLWLSICFCKYVENFYLMDGMHFFPVSFFFFFDIFSEQLRYLFY